MQNVQLEMTLEEAVAIVNLLGALPTSQNAHPLWAKLMVQVEPLLPKPETPAEASKED